MTQRRTPLLIATSLTLAATCGIWWTITGIGHAPNTAAATPEPTPSTAPAVVKPITAADTATAASAHAILATWKDSGAEPANPAEHTPALCSPVPADWYTADAATATGANTTATVVVAAYRAGAAAGTVDQWKTNAKKCANVSETSTKDGFTAVTSTHPAARVTRVLRYGDVIATITVTSLDNPTPVVDSLTTATNTTMTARLKDVCANLDSSNDSSRDPYNPKYKGHTVKRVTELPIINPLPDTLLTAVAQLSTAPTWEPPKKTAYPQLAPYGRPDGSTSLNDAPRYNAPSLVNPDTIAPPAGSPPRNEPVKPAKLGPATMSTTVTTPAVDVAGPGCGWAFTDTAAPRVDTASITKTRTRLTYDALAALTREQGVWLIDTLAWPVQMTNWAHTQQEWNNWARYYDTKTAAENAMSDAREAYSDSLLPWTRPQPTPTPKPTPTVPTPTPTPTGGSTDESGN